ncbi:MAG: sulfur reduction protein DsrS [Gammaproteobacteria bacterium]|nr:sulfur reduction protein DsrS [Gammaproteobacteria bacterium]
MQLSHEDQLRLNVLVAQSLQAVRIDESRMRVHALSEKGEASIDLNPTCKDEKYIRLIQQFLSTHYLGSPGGYPVFLRRWTRMGQARDDSLEKLLLIGEPEAVVAVVHASGLTNELARRAWWTSTNAENARRMLEKENVVKGNMGKELAQFLVEFLPFEEEQKAIIDSVRLVLQPGLIDNETRRGIWKRGKRKNSYYVGFLQQTPDNLPIDATPHEKWGAAARVLKPEVDCGNEYAKLLCRTLGHSGQAFLHVADLVLQKPNDQEAVVALLNAIGKYFECEKTGTRTCRDMQSLSNHVGVLFSDDPKLEKILSIDPDLQPQLDALLSLSMVSESLVDPIFGMTDAIGTVMRKKIEPVTQPIAGYIRLLQT